MIDSFVLLTPILMIGVVALLVFVGCDRVLGLDRPEPPVPELTGIAGDEKVDLRWPESPYAGEFYVRRRDTGVYELIATVSRGRNTYTDNTVTNGVPYSYTVSALGEEGETLPSNELMVTPGPAVSTEFLESDTPGTPVNVTGAFGVAIQLGSADLNIKELGRLFLVNNSGDHIVRVIKITGPTTQQQVGNPVLVSMTGGSPGLFKYAPVLDPGITLEAGAEYYIVSEETNPGDRFYNHDATVRLTQAATDAGAGTVTGAARRSGTTYIRDATGQVSYGLVNFKYQLP